AQAPLVEMRGGKRSRVAGDARQPRGGPGCPFCANLRVSVTNSLARKAPRLAEEWHPTRNGDAGPADVVATSPREWWWKCSRAPDHVWQAIIAHRFLRGSGCPFCSGRRVCRSNSLAGMAPWLAADWPKTKNGALTPEDVTRGSSNNLSRAA